MKASLPYKYITAVKNGKQYVVFDFKSEEGKRKRKWVSTGLPEKCTKKVLTAAVDKIVAEFDKEFRPTMPVNTETISDISSVSVTDVPTVYAVTSDSGMPLGDYFNEWLNYIKPNISRITYQDYKGVIDRFMRYTKEHYPDITLGEIRHTHIQEYINYKLDNGCKGTCVRQYYLALHSAFAYGVKMEYIQSHPMDKLKVPRTEQREATFYNKDELNKLFEVFKDDKLELVVHIAAYYGLRRSEVVGLRWDAVDFINKTITIQRKVVSDYDEDGKYKLFVENRLKTNSTRRTLPLIPHIEKMLLEKKEIEKHFKKVCGESYDNEFDGFICRDKLGKLISPDYVTSHFHYVVTKHGLRHLRFHDLRHSCASLLLANDIPMKTIQEWLGHSNYTITANLYSHLEYNAKVISAETIARVLDSENTSQNNAPAKPEKSEKKATVKKSSSRKTRTINL